MLFHGPPGTGKTLVARALANECGTMASGQQRVAFFMRKGADCLSKWVGESERQLRLLFDQVCVLPGKSSARKISSILLEVLECPLICHQSNWDARQTVVL